MQTGLYHTMLVWPSWKGICICSCICFCICTRLHTYWIVNYCVSSQPADKFIWDPFVVWWSPLPTQSKCFCYTFSLDWAPSSILQVCWNIIWYNGLHSNISMCQAIVRTGLYQTLLWWPSSTEECLKTQDDKADCFAPPNITPIQIAS